MTPRAFSIALVAFFAFAAPACAVESEDEADVEDVEESEAAVVSDTVHKIKPGGAESVAIAKGIHLVLDKELFGQKSELVFQDISRSHNGWAFVEARVQKKGGGEIDWLRTVHKDRVEFGAFDGPILFAVARKKNDGTWKVAGYKGLGGSALHPAMVIGPTDVAWIGFRDDLTRRAHAPKDIFPRTAF